MSGFDGAHVLIVEDSGSSVDVLTGLLDNLNVSYTVVYNSHKVGEVVQQLDRLDAIFLDLEMPGLDGYVVRDMLKTQAELSDVPVVAYSAHSSQMAKVRDAGFNGFLGKPLRASEFPRQLAQIFNKQAVWAIR